MANKQDLVEEAQKQRNKEGGESLPERQVTEEDILDFTKRTGLTVF